MYIKIPTSGNKSGNHTEGFAAAARTKEAHEEAIKSSKSIAVAGFRVARVRLITSSRLTAKYKVARMRLLPSK